MMSSLTLASGAGGEADQLVHEGGGRREADGKTFLASGQTQTQGDMRLAGAGIADRDHVLPAFDIRATRPTAC